MECITEEMIEKRIEERFCRLEAFQQQKKKVSNAIKALDVKTETGQDFCERVNALEDTFAKYSFLYGKEAYRLGVEDGVQIATEHNVKLNKSILTIRDMTHLVYIYDAVKSLNMVLLGDIRVHNQADGVLGALDRVFDVISNGMCSEIRQLEEDEIYEQLLKILDNNKMTPEERAGKLMGK